MEEEKNTFGDLDLLDGQSVCEIAYAGTIFAVAALVWAGGNQKKKQSRMNYGSDLLLSISTIPT